ncbi:MAG: hypothetical protein IH585_16005, partial [Anaerolineaceae bacterium]|nr:hypothetical protein [Anaerolineaceae bacterium]
MISKSSSKNNHRSLILIYFSIAFIGIILLAASIGKLEFEPGLPFPGNDSTNPSLSNSAVDSSRITEQSGINLIILKIGIGVGFLFLSVMIIYSLVRKTNKRKFGLLILGLIGLVIIFKLLQLFRIDLPIIDGNTQEGGVQLPTLDYEIVPIGQPPSELFWIVGISLVIGLISVWAFLFLRTDPKPM